MKSSAATAVVLCPSDGRPDRRLLGLDLGERVLLALAAGGVSQVAFAGDGPRPVCERADIREIPLAELSLPPDKPTAADGTAGAGAGNDGVWVLTCDTVFDRALLQDPAAIPEGLALRWCRTPELAELLADPEAWLASAGAPTAAGGQAADASPDGRGFALRVTDASSQAVARRSLLLSLRKPIDGLVSRHLNRYISTFISRWLVGTGVRPNQLTFVFMLIGVSSAVFAFYAEHWWSLVMAGFLVQMQSILDGCDGEVARLTYQFSHSGQWLDSIGDDLTNYSFCLGLALGQARVLDCLELYLLGGATLLAQLLASGVLYRRMIAMGTGDLLAIPDVTGGGSGDGLGARVFAFVRLLVKRDTFVFILAALTAAQLPLLAFGLFSFGTFAMLIGVLLNERQLLRLEREQDAVT